MVRFFTNMPIYRRLFVAFALAAIVSGVVIVLLGNFYVSSLAAQGQAVRASFDAQSTASQEETNLQRMNAVLEAFHNQIFGSASGVISDPSFFSSGALLDQEVHAREAEFDQALKNYVANYVVTTSPNMSSVHTILMSNDPANGTTIMNSQQTSIENVVNTIWPKYKSDQGIELQNLELLQTKLLNKAVLTPAQVNQLYQNDYATAYNVGEDFTNLKNNWQSVVDAAINIGKTVTTVGSSQTQPIVIATAAAFILSLLVLIATGWLVNITITQPLRRLAMLARRIAKGDTKARANAQAHDEIGRVADAMNKMLDSIVQLAQEAQGQRDMLQGQVEKLVGEVSGVGEGDLRVQAEVTADALGVLADSFNYMVEELSSLIVRVKMVAQEVDGLTATVVDSLAQLVDTGDMQLNRMENAAVEVEHMADSSRNVAERAQVLFNVARQARRSAQTGRQSVQQAVEGMSRINTNVQTTADTVQTLGERSREIDEIVTIISNIAHQTNRLALDAAIQAAMAGENGKGFGAVAADIRRLAERSKEQATGIARIVRSVRDEIGSVAVSMQDTERETAIGTQLTQDAGGALQSIFSAVEQQAVEIESINQVAKHQLESSNTIVQIMQGISQSTQQSSLSTRETAHTMEHLARLVEQLRASVEAFRLRENENYRGSPGSFSITPEHGRQEQLSISGTFRTVTASALPPAGRGAQAALPPARSGDPFAYYPVTPNQPDYNGGWPQPPQNQPAQWPAPYNQQNQPAPYDRPGQYAPVPNGNGNGGGEYDGNWRPSSR